MDGLRDHPLRAALNAEVHSRPFASLQAPERISHLALLSGERGAERDRRHVAALCERFAVAAPTAGDNHFMADFGPFRLKWERHTEFSTYTFFQNGAFDPAAFSGFAVDLVPRDWVIGLPGDLLVGVHLDLLDHKMPLPDAAALARLFGHDNIVGSLVSGGSAEVWMDFTVQDDGFARIMLRDISLHPRQAGRLVQRFLEIETYRIMALLAFPAAKRHGGVLAATGERLTGITGRMTEIEGMGEERALLDELTAFSSEIEDVAAATNYRFGAASAYYALVRRRVEELREQRVEGMQTIGEFIDRRLAPAMRTCEAVSERLEVLSRRVARASELLRTRVDIQLEAQNRDLLQSMDRRARVQLRLQETVEGLSVAAITYYLASLVGYLAKAAKATGLPLDADIATGVSIPVIALLVWAAVRRLRRIVSRENAAGGKT
ncbi:DUF3422 domain-containing protein [Pelagibius litoralis]|uniref:DUF3422 domain-containing protein n=1 Tax=Pelagibius litoralis TaxID=374515 RepID=A0A967KDE0_9PROT|nr:DUF3422 domain-containing protein [Pelagibius litoralis]